VIQSVSQRHYLWLIREYEETIRIYDKDEEDHEHSVSVCTKQVMNATMEVIARQGVSDKSAQNLRTENFHSQKLFMFLQSLIPKF
jgi:hypothetical protein